MAGVTRPVADTAPMDRTQDAGVPAQASQFESALQGVAETHAVAQNAAPASRQSQRGPAAGQILAQHGSHDPGADARSNREFSSQDAAAVQARSLETPAAAVEGNGPHGVHSQEARRFENDHRHGARYYRLYLALQRLFRSLIETVQTIDQNNQLSWQIFRGASILRSMMRSTDISSPMR